MKYTFDPTQYGFLPHSKMPKCLKPYLHKKAFFKVICVSESGSFWYTSCYKNPGFDVWTFVGGLYNAKNDHHSSSTKYFGCIASSRFASTLLIHLLGTFTNKGTLKYGKERLNANSLSITRRKRKIVSLYKN